jgi:hypothetical protein
VEQILIVADVVAQKKKKKKKKNKKKLVPGTKENVEGLVDRNGHETYISSP